MTKLVVDELETGSITAEIKIKGSGLTRVLADGTEIAASEAELNKLFSQPTSVTGQQQYTSTGTYSWVAPAGVYQVDVVAIGGGGAGQDNWANPAGGGAGLGWKNDIPVQPGTSYDVVVGAGATSTTSGNSAQLKGGNSYFVDQVTVAGMGGGNESGSVCYADGPNSNGNSGGGYVGDGGGAGGSAPSYQGGGGAGGYQSRGGNGNESSFPNYSSDGAGAGGGGYYSSTYGSAAGGGTGLTGEGPLNGGQPAYNPWQGYTTSLGSGAGGSGRAGGQNGYYGENPWSGTAQSSTDIRGGDYGGGGGGPGTSWPNASGNGGVGGVRIIWGPPGSRSYPSNAT
jgi:hypothetical protein